MLIKEGLPSTQLITTCYQVCVEVSDTLGVSDTAVNEIIVPLRELSKKVEDESLRTDSGISFTISRKDPWE